jgi:hypothetical protein
MARRRFHVALLFAAAWNLLPKESFVNVHHTARTSRMSRVVLLATREDHDSGMIELAPTALGEPAVTEDPLKGQPGHHVAALNRRSGRSGWQWSPCPKHVGVIEGITEQPETDDEDGDPIQRTEVRCNVEEARITDAERAEAKRAWDRGRARSDGMKQTTAAQAKRKFTAEERLALRLPVVDEQKIAFEQEDNVIQENLGPLGGWVYRKCQPRRWGPHGILQFKLLLFAFMWVFMTSVSPFLIDIFISLERRMP